VEGEGEGEGEGKETTGEDSVPCAETEVFLGVSSIGDEFALRLRELLLPMYGVLRVPTGSYCRIAVKMDRNKVEERKKKKEGN